MANFVGDSTRLDLTRDWLHLSPPLPLHRPHPSFPLPSLHFYLTWALINISLRRQAAQTKQSAELRQTSVQCSVGSGRGGGGERKGGKGRVTCHIHCLFSLRIFPWRALIANFLRHILQKSPFFSSFFFLFIILFGLCVCVCFSFCHLTFLFVCFC